MSFVMLNANMQRHRKALNELQEVFRQERESAEQHAHTIFKAAWEKTFPNNACKFIASATGDYAHVYLYDVVMHNVEKGWMEHVAFLAGGEWGKQDPADTNGYGVPCAGPFPFSELRDFISALERANPGLTVELSELGQRKRTAVITEINSFRAIQLLHPGKAVVHVASGEKWYVGWDIADKYVIVTIDREKWAWWSTDAHGGPMTHSAKEGTEAWTAFESWRDND